MPAPEIQAIIDRLDQAYAALTDSLKGYLRDHSQEIAGR